MLMPTGARPGGRRGSSGGSGVAGVAGGSAPRPPALPLEEGAAGPGGGSARVPGRRWGGWRGRVGALSRLSGPQGLSRNLPTPQDPHGRCRGDDALAGLARPGEPGIGHSSPARRKRPPQPTSDPSRTPDTRRARNERRASRPAGRLVPVAVESSPFGRVVRGLRPPGPAAGRASPRPRRALTAPARLRRAADASRRRVGPRVERVSRVGRVVRARPPARTVAGRYRRSVPGRSPPVRVPARLTRTSCAGPCPAPVGGGVGASRAERATGRSLPPGPGRVKRRAAARLPVLGAPGAPAVRVRLPLDIVAGRERGRVDRSASRPPHRPGDGQEVAGYEKRTVRNHTYARADDHHHKRGDETRDQDQGGRPPGQCGHTQPGRRPGREPPDRGAPDNQ